MTRYIAYALLIVLAILSSMAILQQLDEMNQPTLLWGPR
jgi:hypothetical protein